MRPILSDTVIVRLTRSRSNCDVMKHKVMEVIVQRLKDIDVDMNHKENVIDI